MWKNWWLAFRPKTLTAGIVPVLVATALVRAEGYTIIWWITVCALLSSIFIQIGTNFVNDAIDFKKGADDEKRIGPQRVTQSGLLTGRQVMRGGLLCFAIAMAFGVPLVIVGGPPILAIGLCSLFCGYCYTGGPYPLAYKGLGDLFVILFYGFVAVLGTFYLHTKLVTWSGCLAGAQIGLLATALIAINNLRDSPLDVIVNKKTLAVRLGEGGARAEIASCLFLPFALSLLWILQDHFWAALVPMFILPLAKRIVRGVYANPPSPIYNKFLGQSAAVHLIFGLLLCAGLCLK
jgi:1,4-dihydroxy-2-naphthoate octaprenyltransferase